MEENNIVMAEENNPEIDTVDEEYTGSGFGVGVVAGGLIALALSAGGKKLKELYTDYKAKKESKKTEKSQVIDITNDVKPVDSNK